MLEDGPSQVISVEGASLGSVASDQPFGRLDSHFSSLVSSGMVGSAHPVDDSKLVAEVLHHLGGEHLGPVTGQHHRDAEDGHVGAENVDDLLAGVPVQLEHRQPATVAVYNSQVCVRGDGEEIRT